MKAKNRKRKIFKKLCILVVSFVLLFYFLQRFWAHREKEVYPDYPKEHLTEESDYVLTSHVFPTQVKTRHQSRVVNDGAYVLHTLKKCQDCGSGF